MGRLRDYPTDLLTTSQRESLLRGGGGWQAVDLRVCLRTWDVTEEAAR